MLVINRETDYAARIVLFLARRPPGTRMTAQEVARQCLVPRAIVRRVVTRLSGAGILTSARGVGGGISLARPPAEISLLDVVEAMEGPPILNLCVRDPQECPLMEQCTVHLAWVQASGQLVDYLRNTTFAQLAEGAPPAP
ncbi:MAG: Rrf2 family transcriptional regulator [Anaerolineae bacterium]|nr:Rrf2 family transcriptional regulator [Anaerolineae bacterium]